MTVPIQIQELERYSYAERMLCPVITKTLKQPSRYWMLTAGFISSQFRDLVVFGLLIITLVIRPTGLFGKSVSEKV